MLTPEPGSRAASLHSKRPKTLLYLALSANTLAFIDLIIALSELGFASLLIGPVAALCTLLYFLIVTSIVLYHRRHPVRGSYSPMLTNTAIVFAYMLVPLWIVALVLTIWIAATGDFLEGTQVVQIIFSVAEAVLMFTIGRVAQKTRRLGLQPYIV